MTLELTKDEAYVLASLIDVAVKTAGIQAAKAAVPIYEKLEAAAREEAKKGAECPA